MSATPQVVREALTDRYVSDPGQESNVAQDDVIELLRQLPEDALAGQGLLVDQITRTEPTWRLPDADRATIVAIDDCNKVVFQLYDLEPEIEAQLTALLPELTCQLLLNPCLPLEELDNSILKIMDLIVSSGVGWSNDLGRNGERLLNKIAETVTQVRSDPTSAETLVTDLNEFLTKEQARTTKLEDRLVASETGQLRSQRSKIQAAQMINEKMRGKFMTETITEFMKGPWYDSVQLLLLTKGFDGEAWFRAEKLTDTILWTYQPTEDEKETQRLYRIIEHLPAEMRELLVSLTHNTDSAEESLDAIENEHIQIMSGFKLEPVEVTPIEVDEEVFNQSTSVSRILLRKVKALEAGQWFTFEEEGLTSRIKLVLMLDDVKQLVFTNRNGMKALQKSFDEMAYYLSSGVIKPLNHEHAFTNAYRSFYEGLVTAHQNRQQRAAKEEEELARQEAEAEEAKQKAIAEARARAAAEEQAEQERREAETEARLSQAREMAGLEENREKVVELTNIVQAMNVGAWLKLPSPDGQMEDCKLAVKLAGADKMIFVSRTGAKIGDYNTEQLVQLLLAGQGEIQEAGIEFEDTLAQVVSKLRVDRNRSYDDLTGS